MFDKSRIVFINNIDLKESVILLKAHAAFLYLFPNHLLILRLSSFQKMETKLKRNQDLSRFMLAKLRIVFTIHINNIKSKESAFFSEARAYLDLFPEI